MKAESGFRNIGDARCRAVPLMTQLEVPHTIGELAIDHRAPVRRCSRMARLSEKEWRIRTGRVCQIELRGMSICNSSRRHTPFREK
jgi:hypothetical protein